MHAATFATHCFNLYSSNPLSVSPPSCHLWYAPDNLHTRLSLQSMLASWTGDLTRLPLHVIDPLCSLASGRSLRLCKLPSFQHARLPLVHARPPSSAEFHLQSIVLVSMESSRLQQSPCPSQRCLQMPLESVPVGPLSCCNAYPMTILSVLL